MSRGQQNGKHLVVLKDLVCGSQGSPSEEDKVHYEGRVQSPQGAGGAQLLYEWLGSGASD